MTNITLLATPLVVLALVNLIKRTGVGAGLATPIGVLLGVLLGISDYYLGDVGMGVAMTLTLGGFGVWALIDGLFIQRRIAEKNAAIRAQLA